jgi:hypothetical protein
MSMMSLVMIRPLKPLRRIHRPRRQFGGNVTATSECGGQLGLNSKIAAAPGHGNQIPRSDAEIRNRLIFSHCALDPP